MNINDLTIGQAREIAALVAAVPAVSQPVASKNVLPIGKHVIVRSRDAGVMFGIYDGNDGSTVTLKNAIQMWQWYAAKGISLVDVAEYGVKKDKCKFSTAQGSVVIFNACALIECSDEAAKAILAVGA